MIRIITTLLFISLSSLSFSQQLLRDIGSGNGNTFYEPQTKTISEVHNDTLPLILKVDNNYAQISFKVANDDSIYTIPTYFNYWSYDIKSLHYIKGYFLVNLQNSTNDKLLSIDLNGNQQTVWEKLISTEGRFINVYQIDTGLMFLHWKIGGYTSMYIWNPENGIVPITTYQNLSQPQNITVIDNVLYFTSASSITGGELWKSDGTDAGTFMIRELVPTPLATNPQNFSKGDDGFVYFSGLTDIGGYSNGKRIYKTDGTYSGTTMVFNSPHDHQGLDPKNIKKLGNKLIFDSNAGFYAYNIGTNALISLIPTDSYGEFSFLMNGKLISFRRFANTNGLYNLELWETDGTPTGTLKLKIIDENISGISSRAWQNGTTAYFELSTSSNNIYNESKIDYWITDGTLLGTKNLGEIDPNFKPKNRKGAMGILGNHFIVNDYYENVGYELIKVDANFVTVVSDRNKYEFSGDPNTFFIANDTVYFMASNNKEGRELWQTDGTSAGTKQVFDWVKYANNFENGNSSYHSNDDFIDFNGGFLYIHPTENSLNYFNTATHIISTLAINFRHFNGLYKDEHFLTSSNGKVIFTNYGNYTGREIWTTDGTVGGTALLKDLNPGYLDSYPFKYTKLENGTVLFFTGSSNAVWKTDGTHAGTQMISSLSSNINFNNDVRGIVKGNAAYFSGYDASTGSYAVWKATESSFTKVSSTQTYYGWYDAKNVVTIGNKSYFPNLSTNTKINSMDQTDTVSDLFTMPSSIYSIMAFNDTLYFNTSINNELWLYKYDGTTTVPILKLKDTFGFGYINSLINLGNNSFLIHTTNFNEVPVNRKSTFYISDGTASGTKEILSVPVQNESTDDRYIKDYIIHNNKMYFSYATSSAGKELWVLNFSCPNQIVISSSLTESAGITANAHIILETAIYKNTNLSAGNSIQINPGTLVSGDGVFKAEIKNCTY
jgi:ELWxxDGT repeat protein